MKKLLLLLIRGYQIALSPFFGAQCRFHPTCSHYAQEAITRYGAGRGGRLALGRLCRCHPFTQGGYDPVPDLTASRATAATRRCTVKLPRP